MSMTLALLACGKSEAPAEAPGPLFGSVPDVELEFEGEAYDATAGDWNDDGYDDLAVRVLQDPAVRVYPGGPQGPRADGVILLSPDPYGVGLSTGDLDGDGVDDLVSSVSRETGEDILV